MRPNLSSACLDEIDMDLFSLTSLNLVEFADPVSAQCDIQVA